MVSQCTCMYTRYSKKYLCTDVLSTDVLSIAVKLVVASCGSKLVVARNCGWVSVPRYRWQCADEFTDVAPSFCTTCMSAL